MIFLFFALALAQWHRPRRTLTLRVLQEESKPQKQSGVPLRTALKKSQSTSARQKIPAASKKLRVDDFLLLGKGECKYRNNADVDSNFTHVITPPPCLTTDSESVPCVFPFIDNSTNLTHYGCITMDGSLSCATDVDAEGVMNKTGVCKPNCPNDGDPDRHEAACIENCRADCSGYAVKAHEECRTYLKVDDRKLRAQTNSSATTNYECKVKSAAYALSFPYYGVFSPAMEESATEVCVRADVYNRELTSLPRVEFITANFTRCAVACASFGLISTLGWGTTCHCGEFTETVTCPSTRTRMMRTEKRMTQYKIQYPKLNADCPDGANNFPSRYIHSGDAVIKFIKDNAREAKNFTDLASGSLDNCFNLCAQECTAYGVGCHGYTCVTPMTQDFVTDVSQDSWDGSSNSSCYLFVATLPTSSRPLQPEDYSDPGGWNSEELKQFTRHLICARRDCNEMTTCPNDFERITGFVSLYSSNKINGSTNNASTDGTCSACAATCRVTDGCESYQCTETMALQYNGSDDHCQFFNSPTPDGLERFNISDVSFCRKRAKERCTSRDGYLGTKDPCSCGSTICVSGLACQDIGKSPASCINVTTGCGEGMIRAMHNGSCDTTCMLKADCDVDAYCVQNSTCTRPMPPPAVCNAIDQSLVIRSPVCCEMDGNNVTLNSELEAKCRTGNDTCDNIVPGNCETRFECKCDNATCTLADVICLNNASYRSICDAKNFFNTRQEMEDVEFFQDKSYTNGTCTRSCTEVGQSHCECGNVTCDANKGKYCNNEDPKACSSLCYSLPDDDTDCICRSSGNLTYCTDGEFCSNLNAGGCVSKCDSMSNLTDQIDATCRCNRTSITRSLFCGNGEVCTDSPDVGSECIKVCNATGEVDCLCIKNTTATQCGASDSTAANMIGVMGNCSCMTTCRQTGQKDCLCGTDTSVACSGTNEVCSALSGIGAGECTDTCNVNGQNCLCQNTDGHPAQFCTGGTFCSTTSIVSGNGLSSKVEYCVPACSSDDAGLKTNCMCGSVGSEELCASKHGEPGQYCVGGVCTPGADNTDGSSQTTGICGVKADGSLVECTHEYCIHVIKGDTVTPECKPEKPPLCGGWRIDGPVDADIDGSNYNSKTCVCSRNETNRDRICAAGTYCVAEVGACLNKTIQVCEIGVIDTPCSCCVKTGEGICATGNMCTAQAKESCSCRAPFRTCFDDILHNERLTSDCICGWNNEYCTKTETCVLDDTQAYPNTLQCKAGMVASANQSFSTGCGLNIYGHCQATTTTEAMRRGKATAFVHRTDSVVLREVSDSIAPGEDEDTTNSTVMFKARKKQRVLEAARVDEELAISTAPGEDEDTTNSTVMLKARKKQRVLETDPPLKEGD